MTRPLRDAGGLSSDELLRGRAVLPLSLAGLINRGACNWMRVFPCGARTDDPGIVLSWVAADRRWHIALLSEVHSTSTRSPWGSRNMCLVPCDHVPRRSYPLFQAREVMKALAGGPSRRHGAQYTPRGRDKV